MFSHASRSNLEDAPPSIYSNQGETGLQNTAISLDDISQEHQSSIEVRLIETQRFPIS